MSYVDETVANVTAALESNGMWETTLFVWSTGALGPNHARRHHQTLHYLLRCAPWDFLNVLVLVLLVLLFLLVLLLLLLLLLLLVLVLPLPPPPPLLLMLLLMLLMLLLCINGEILKFAPKDNGSPVQVAGSNHPLVSL